MLEKPTKPKTKKPKLPPKPKEPQRFIHPKTFAIINRYSESYNVEKSLRCSKEKKITFENDEFHIEIDTGNKSNYPEIKVRIPDPDYDNKLLNHQEKLVTYHEKMKAIKPELDKYQSVMAEYEYNLAKYKMQEKEAALKKIKKEVKSSIAG